MEAKASTKSLGARTSSARDFVLVVVVRPGKVGSRLGAWARRVYYLVVVENNGGVSRFVWMRSARRRPARLRFAALRSARKSSVLSSFARLRSAPLRVAMLSFASIRCAVLSLA